MNIYPFVSIVVAIRNEELYIRKCLESLLNQNYPKEKYEIIVVDGFSEDRTREIVADVNKEYNYKLKILDNPKFLASSGRNIGIKESKGNYVGIFGGHTIAENNWITELVEILNNTNGNVAAIGSTTLTGNKNALTEAQEFVLSSKFGGFNTDEANQIDLKHRNKNENFFESKSLCFLLYKKKILEEVGLNDETLFSGDDAELNLRIRKAGYKFLGTRKSKVFFYRRDTIKKFFKRIYEFGQARAIIIKKHPDTFKFFWIIPSLFIIFLILLGVFNLFLLVLNALGIYVFNEIWFLNYKLDTIIQILYFTVIGIYFLLDILFSLTGSKYFNYKSSLFYALILFPCIHLGFGLGFIRGLFPYKAIKPQR